MKIIVTGCAGFIGSHLTEALLEDGHEVTGIDCFNDNYARSEKLRNISQARESDSFSLLPMDLSSGDLTGILQDHEQVFHLAGEPGVRTSWGEKFSSYQQNNIATTQRLLEAATKAKNIGIVYASSSSVYGQAESLPTRESATPRPFSPYGVTKLAAEHLCTLYHGNFGVDVVSLRYFSVYGPRQRPDMGFRRFCDAALNREPIFIYGTGEQTRDFTYVKDVVAATRAAAEATNVGGMVMNIGGGSQVSVNDALAHLGEILGSELDLRYEEHEQGDVMNTCADSSLARASLGFVPTVEWREGLFREFEWAKSIKIAP